MTDQPDQRGASAPATIKKERGMKHLIWHAAYSRWYDHRAAGHRRRARAWGWAADQLCSALWPPR